MNVTYIKDLVERIIATFVVAFVPIYLAAPDSKATAWSAGLAGIAAALSFIKGVAAKFLGNTDTASLVV